MRQRSTVLAVVLVLAVAFATPAAASSLGLAGSPSDSAAQSGTALSTSPQNNTTNDSVKPGAKLAGVVSVQGTEVSGEVEQRSFGHQIARSNSNASKAAVVAGQSQDLERRLTEIREQQETLRAMYGNDSISQGQYKARMAKHAAEARTIQHILNTSAEVAKGIPEETLEAHGVNVETLDRLRTNANNLTGPEVAAIAREIAGNNVGGTNVTVGPKGNVTVGPPGNAPTGPPGATAGGPDDDSNHGSDGTMDATTEAPDSNTTVTNTTDTTTAYVDAAF